MKDQTRDGVLAGITGVYRIPLASVASARRPERNKQLAARMTIVDGGWSVDFVVESSKDKQETFSLAAAARMYSRA